MTFTWPADLPQKALWGTLPGQVASKTVHLAGKKSKNCLWDTCSGGASGQVNVTRAGFAVSYIVYILVGNRFRSLSFQPMSITTPPPE